MVPLTGVVRDYAWGSPTAIPELLGQAPTGTPVAEVWFGAHPGDPAGLPDGRTLRDAIAAEPDRLLGRDVTSVLGTELPYLLKLLAPAKPLSLQVHPTVELAQLGYAIEEEAGVPIDAADRTYKDRNHKPEMIYALTRYEALCGFRAPRRALELLRGLDVPLAHRLTEIVRGARLGSGMREAFVTVLRTAASRPEQVDEFVLACRSRSAQSSPSPRIDRIISYLGDHFPGDPGVVGALLLNPVTLMPGQSLFVPAGAVHTSLSGLAVEIQASSDNVVRAGLTVKHVDAEAMLTLVDDAAAPPMRLAPEPHGAQDIFYAPVDDFELSVVRVASDELGHDGSVDIRGRGPRILLGIHGEVTITVDGQRSVLTPGRAVFVGADEGQIRAFGYGRVVQAAVP